MNGTVDSIDCAIFNIVSLTSIDCASKDTVDADSQSNVTNSATRSERACSLREK